MRFLCLLLLFRVYLSCRLYLAPSLLSVDAGFGIFSGIDLEIDTPVISDSTALIDDLLLEEYQLSNYFYASKHSDFAIAVFGPSMMINHLENPNLNRVWSSDSVFAIQTVNLRPYSTYSRLDFHTKTNIRAGDELYTRYGSSDWFVSRNIPYNASSGAGPSYSINELQNRGHCLDNVRVASSLIPFAGKGLFATRKFRKGELVTLSPLLVAPLHQIMKEGSTSLLINYMITSTGSDFAILPIGHAALANHGGGNSNLEYDWYDVEKWNQQILPINERVDTKKKLFETKSTSDLLDSPSGSLYFGYYATRDILEGEELTISYGSVWEGAFVRYLDSLEAWMRINGEMDMITAPQFRHPLLSPSWDFFPRQMMKRCVGKDCQGRESSLTPYQQLQKKLNQQRHTSMNRKVIADSKKKFQELMESHGGTCRTEEGNWFNQLRSQMRNILGLPCLQ